MVDRVLNTPGEEVKVNLIVILLLAAACVRADVIYYVNSLDESLGWLNTETGQSNVRAVTLGNIPNDVVVAGNRLYVVNSGYNTLQVIDRTQLSTIDEIELAGAVNPYSCVVVDEQRVAVTGLISGTLSIVNTQTFSVDTTFLSGVGPQAVSLHEGVLYVLNTGVAFPEFGVGVLKRYNSETLSFIDSLSVGVNAQAMEFVDNELHILCTGNYDDVSGSVTIVDLATMTIDSVLQLGGSPGALSHSGDVMYVAAGGWVDHGHVYQYSTRTRAILHNSTNPILTGVGASDIVARPDGGFAVSCFQSNEIQWCNEGGESCETFETSAGPGALAVVFATLPVEPAPRTWPENYQILRAYPNPFNGATSFTWDTPLQQPATLVVSDILGRVTAYLPVAAGATRTFWSPRNGEAASGSYLASWQGERFAEPIRIVYIK